MSFKDEIRFKHALLIDGLQCTEAFLSFLLEKGVLLTGDVELINDTVDSQSKNDCCIDILKRKGPCFDNFVKALDYTRQVELADALSPNRERKILLSEADNDLNNQVLHHVGENHVNKDFRLETHYCMFSKPRGFAMIVHIKDFENEPRLHRKGSEKDCESLISLFKSLYFKVEVLSNLSKDEIYSKLEEIEKSDGNYAQMKQHDAFILVILSHGKLKYFQTHDNEFFEINELVGRLSKVVFLENKPKMFFIQACQNEREGSSRSNTFQGGTNQNDSGNNTDYMNEEYVGGSHDTIVAYATLPGKKAYRDVDSGSWFIQSLIQILKEKAQEDDILQMLTSVNREVYTKHNNQVCKIESTLLKKVKFYPGYTR